MTPYERGASKALQQLKLSFLSPQMTRSLIGAGVGGALGAGAGAISGHSADPNDPSSSGTRGRNALIGGGLGALLGGSAGYMSNKGVAQAGGLFGRKPGTAAPQLGAARSQSYENLGGASTHNPSNLPGGSTGMGGLASQVQAGNAAAVAPFSHIPDPTGTQYMPEGSLHTTPLATPAAYAATQPTTQMPARAPVQYAPTTPPQGQSLSEMIAEGSDRMRRANAEAISRLGSVSTPAQQAVTAR
jgi:hypothetical protein